MHPFNPYAFSPPDFASLAAKSEKLGKLVHRIPFPEEAKAQDCTEEEEESNSVYVDFKDADSSIALTEAILEHDFGIHVNLRRDRLCPPVPNRINYIAWLQDLLDQSTRIARLISISEESEEEDKRPAKRTKQHVDSIRVLDIGTGASCIYPLLGCMLHDWTFIATDVDPDSIEAAQAIIHDPRNQGISQARYSRNRLINLINRIHLSLRRPEDTLLLDQKDIESLRLNSISWPRMEKGLLYHVAMCNPPFYSNEEEMQALSRIKIQGPSAVCLGSKEEMTYPGGEVAFVTRIIEESRNLKDCVLWFTSMLGRWSSVAPLLEIIGKEKVENIFVTPLVQGKTTRWAISWSFQPYRIDITKLHSEQYCVPKYLPLIRGHLTRLIEYHVYRPYFHLENEDQARKNLTDYMDGFAIPWTPNGEGKSLKIVVLAPTKSWGRKGRRKRERNSTTQPSNHENKLYSKNLLLGVELEIDVLSISPTWLYGHDLGIFESFVSFVKDWVKQLPQQIPPHQALSQQ